MTEVDNAIMENGGLGHEGGGIENLKSFWKNPMEG